MTRSGLYWSRAPKEIYCFLLGLRSNRPSAHPAKFDTSDTEDEPEKPRSRTRLDGVYESLQSMDWGDGFLPTLLAPFIGVLPSKDLLMVFYIWSIRVAKVLGKAASTRLVRAVLESNAFCRDNDKLTEDARISIEALLKAARVAEPEEDLALQLDLSGSSVLFHNDLEFSEPLSPAGSFLTAMCHRIKDGLIDGGMLGEFTEVPHSLITTDRGIMPDAEIEIEFDNFASACMAGLLHVDLDTIHLMGLMRIAAVLEHGAGEKFYYRKTILSQVWTVALARTFAEFNKLKGEGRSR
ncbi:hypothetical protein NOF04DRAFT_12092 [Fusarium oxysporum II5]|uniref:Uncharacterized protein n=1 Tax=Fusarium odoratissimum (strain NRRL 54006) TaxID=1089451 RepID=X0KFZ9_FUSO5|nr:uncharacterized protein FOIG_02642 [Fusarium odoratissimum NRRL 54006]EXM07662.1 hypothetical protein FOIG_02642 [Fusarium odoratissimum NRRL 54006]KAK2130899.1 hypothetical protein NOF04DRAFT_12092 [Fusarium oxysporum II5]